MALRELVGQVRVHVASPDRGKRKHLRGVFTIAVPSSIGPAKDLPGPSAPPLSVEIDFIECLPWAAVADKVKELIDRGVRYADIAAQLSCPRSWPAKALAYWHATSGLAVPDGRALRDRLSATSAMLDRQEQAIQLWRQGLLMQEVATQLGCCRDTVTALIQDWHTARGLEVPDGRARRKELSRGKKSDSSDTQTERGND